MAKYNVLISRTNIFDISLDGTSLKQALSISRDYKDHYFTSIKILKNGVPILWWRRDPNGDGSRWFRAQL